MLPIALTVRSSWSLESRVDHSGWTVSNGAFGDKAMRRLLSCSLILGCETETGSSVAANSKLVTMWGCRL